MQRKPLARAAATAAAALVLGSAGAAAAPAVTFTKISMGGSFSCAVTSAGAAMCWGHNQNGSLGDGTTTNRSRPVLVRGLASGVRTISAGYQHACAVKTTGQVLCWGGNIYGAVGNGTYRNQLVPGPVVGLDTVASIWAGPWTTCAVTTAGGAKCWGYNTTGALGDGTTVTRPTPRFVLGLRRGVREVGGGGTHTCAVLSNGSMKCWGNNGAGQLGDGTAIDRLAPVQVQGLGSGVRAFKAGYYHTCANTAGGRLMCWGANASGQLGDGTTTNRPLPGVVPGFGAGTHSFTASQDSTCAARAGAAKCWGLNDEGALGDGTTIDRHLPTPVSGLGSGVAVINGLGMHHCALLTSGRIKCWGPGRYGQLGNGTTANSLVPVWVTP